MPAKILYKNLIPSAIVSAVNPDIATGSNFKALLFGRIYTPCFFDSPGVSITIDLDFTTDITADFIGIAAHDFEESDNAAKIQVFHSPDDIAYTLAGEMDLVTGKSQGLVFTEDTKRYWRIVIDANTVLGQHSIGYLSLGKALELPRVMAPYKPAGDIQPENTDRNISEAGGLISSNVGYRPVSVNLSLRNYESQFILDNIPELAEYIAVNPFFYMWNTLLPQETVLAWVVNEVVKPMFNDNYKADWNQQAVGIARI